MKISEAEAKAFRAISVTREAIAAQMRMSEEKSQKLWAQMRRKYKLNEKSAYSVDTKKKTLDEIGAGE